MAQNLSMEKNAAEKALHLFREMAPRGWFARAIASLTGQDELCDNDLSAVELWNMDGNHDALVDLHRLSVANTMGQEHFNAGSIVLNMTRRMR